MTGDDPLRVGVIGVGSMGAHHARVFSEIPEAELLGVADADQERAATVAESHGTRHVRSDELIDAADAVTIAVPTHAHYDLARECITAGTHLLVEKPFVPEPAEGRELDRQARHADLVLQVGMIERFNPAVRTLFDLVDPTDIVALRADRLGPPVQRDGSDDVVMDLMIHDIDILLRLMGEAPTNVSGANREETYASALMEFGDATVATLTASRVTQRKVRSLEVTIPDRHLIVDFIDQSIRIHRRSRPSYLQDDTEMRYRHESIIEQPLIESAEPLRLELEAFVDAVTNGSEPVVTAEDGLAALEVAQTIQCDLVPQEAEAPRL